MTDNTKHNYTPNVIRPGKSKIAVLPTVDSPVPSARIKHSRKLVLLACLGLAIISTTLAVIVVVSKDKSADKSTTNPAAAVDISPEVQDVNDRIANGEPAEAEKVLAENPELKNSRDGKMLAASIAYANGDYTGGIQQYQSLASEYGWNSNIADRIARGYVLLGDKQNAITYYNKAIELIAKENNPTKQSEEDSWRNQIEELKK